MEVDLRTIAFAVAHGLQSGSSDPQAGTVWLEFDKLPQLEKQKIYQTIADAIKIGPPQEAGFE